MNYKLLSLAAAIIGISAILASCEKDAVSTPAQTSPLPTTTSASFVEQFNNVGELSNKGWVFKNNSAPIGANGWRQGRYEPAPSAKFPEPMIGFPAYNSETTPNDFVSCDASSVNAVGEISAWLISPQLPMKNGDQIIFYTRAVNDANYPIFIKDRMQVRGNFSNGDANVGRNPSDTGSFRLLLDINPGYVNNDPGGYPLGWRKYTVTVAGLPAPVANGRFAFRYMGTNAGINGPNYAGVVGVDSLAFVSK